MANHGYVKTRKMMSVEKINQLLDELNQANFKGNLKIEYHKGDEHSWGPHVWMLEYPCEDKKSNWGTRVCWLNTARSFEMRHGGGGDFIWWIDSLILDTLAVKFNGRISDDGVSGSWPGEPEKLQTYEDYIERRFDHCKNPEMRKLCIDMALELTPPEFRFETENGKKKRQSKTTKAKN